MQDRLTKTLGPEALAWWRAAEARAAKDGAQTILELLPALARRIGRASIGAGLHREPIAGASQPAVVDLAAWRACDAAGLLLLRAGKAPDATIVDLYLHGDLEERTIVLRSLALLPIADATARLLEEVQRTNMVPHFEAAVCDSNLLARAHEHPAIGAAWTNRLVLKAAFIGLDAARMIDVLDLANPELSRMLQDLATEREAAGRAVWPDTWRFVGKAPATGSVARLIGGIEHGADPVRRAAAEGLLLLDAKSRAGIIGLVRERVAREPREDIRALLTRLIES